jgi:hypothetical protein
MARIWRLCRMMCLSLDPHTEYNPILFLNIFHFIQELRSTPCGPCVLEEGLGG